jgi:hypothetical protein
MGYSEQFMSQRLSVDDNQAVIHSTTDQLDGKPFSCVNGRVDIKVNRFPKNFAGNHDFRGKGWGNPGVYWTADCNSYVLVESDGYDGYRGNGAYTWMSDAGGPKRVILACINGIGEIRWTVQPPHGGDMGEFWGNTDGDLDAVLAFDLFPAKVSD